MTKTSTTILFFGSGPVAARSLELLAKNFEIEAVVTKPKPAGHHGDFPVISLAEKLGLKTFTVLNKQELSALFASKPVKSQLGVVIDFGIIIAQDVIDYFPLGIVNSHFSLLPQWRGADPISFAILSGQPKTGVSLMVIDAGLDTGKLITQKVLPISPTDTTPSLTDKLIILSNNLLADYLPRYISGEIKPHAQPHPTRASHSRKLTKEDGLIEWSKPAEQLEREIRAFIDWPKSYTRLGGKEVIITGARAESREQRADGEKLGEVIVEDKQLLVQTGDGLLVIEKLKPAGKAEMSAQAFLAGYKIN